MVHVGGEVRHPGAYAWFPGMTVRQLVGAAGGLTPEGAGSRLEILRKATDRIRKRSAPSTNPSKREQHRPPLTTWPGERPAPLMLKHRFVEQPDGRAGRAISMRPCEFEDGRARPRLDTPALVTSLRASPAD